MRDYYVFDSPLYNVRTQIKSVTISDEVTTIGSYVFYRCSALTPITIPGGVTTIGNSAFYGCRSLESITIPSSVTELGEGAFMSCLSLTAVEFESGSTITTISKSLFGSCFKLSEINIPESVMTIDEAAFSDCIALTSITIPGGVTSIGKRAFYNCRSLATIINNHNGNQTIGENAFQDCGIGLSGEKRAYAYTDNENFIAAIKAAGYRVNYTISFESNGAVVGQLTEVPYDSTIMAPADPTREGFVFAGWYKDNELNERWDFDTDTVTSDVTLYAKWTEEEYTLKFDSNGGTDVSPITVKYGDAITLPTPTRANYIFEGWYEEEMDNNGSGTQFTATTMPDLGANGTEKTLYAKWRAKTPIDYSPSPVAFTYGDADAEYTVSYLGLIGFKVEYYVSGAWIEAAPKDAGIYDIRISRAEDETYASYDSGILDDYFVINPAELTVSVKPGLIITKAYDGTTTVTGVEPDWLVLEGLKNGETASALGTWNYDDANAEMGKTINITGISIIYDGTASSNNYTYTPVALTATGDITNASQPKTNVTINYAAETVNTTVLMEYSTDETGWTSCADNMAIDAGWFGNNVYFRLKAKPNYDAGEIQTLNIPARPATPAATGISETWFGQGNSKISGVNATMEYRIGTDESWSDITGEELTGLAAGTYYIRVKATESSFRSLEQEIVLTDGPKITVTFIENGGSEVADITGLSYNALISAPSPDPTREGYTFSGWYRDSALENEWNFGTDRVVENTNLYAKWTIEEYTLEFDSNGGTDVSDITANYGDAITLPTPTREGYMFDGWYEDETDNNGSGTQFTATTMPDLGPDGTVKTLYAKWTINSYTLVYKAGEHGSISGSMTQSVSHGGSGTTVTAIPDTGYRFARWSDGVTTASRTDTNITGNIEVTAEFEINIYKVTFDSNGGSAVSSQTVPYNTTAAEPKAPAREGYTFEGWYSDSMLSTRFDFSTPIKGDITLYAKWEYNLEPEEDQAKTIMVTEVTSSLFAGREGQISASANMENAFSSSVEVKIPETDVVKESFGFSIADEVFSFDISLYIKGTGQKTKPAQGLLGDHLAAGAGKPIEREGRNHRCAYIRKRRRNSNSIEA
ncbi:MAG: leucine-rich repeat protein [Clostridiaceae bacterium]|nr:leucine-rich repeat protein [Clostridiaceae bacterium]